MNTSRPTNGAKRIFARITAVLVALACLLLCSACVFGGPADTDTTGNHAGTPLASQEDGRDSTSISENATCTSKDEVALYLHRYGHLPSNFISKTKAKKAGWMPDKGNLWDVCPGKSIGGGPFYNDDGLLPSAAGRSWKECDIDYAGGFRGPKRIVYSSDGLIYYTGNHYRSFERLY